MKENFTWKLNCAEVPKRFLGCRLDNFDPYSAVLKAKLELVRKAVTANAESRGVLLFGPPCGGKTHLSVGLAYELLVRGLEGRFVGSLEYVLNVQAAYGNPKEIIDGMLCDANFIVLDDLGTERNNDTARIALLYLVNEIYAKRKRLIVTSNLGLKDIQKFEPRIASRLAEVCSLIELRTDDYRLRMAAERQKTESPLGKAVN
jgi:DNA replication protein DnaC